MGRGDKRTAKGKRFKKSYGNSRPHKVKKTTGQTATPKKEKAVKVKSEKTVKKAPAKKTAKKKAD